MPKQTRIMSNPGHLWSLILILIPICTSCQGLSPRERFPLVVGTTEGIDHCTPITSRSPCRRNSPIQGWVASCCLSKMQPCDHPTDNLKKRFNFSHKALKAKYVAGNRNWDELPSAVVLLLWLLGSVWIFFPMGKLHRRGRNGSSGIRTPGNPKKIICNCNYLTQALCFCSGNLSSLLYCSLWLHPISQINRAEQFKLISTWSFLPRILKFSIIPFYFPVRWWAVTGLFLNKARIGGREKCDLLGTLKKSQDSLKS